MTHILVPRHSKIRPIDATYLHIKKLKESVNICRIKYKIKGLNFKKELKGKLQSKKADFKEKFDDSKVIIAKKINDKLDEKEEDKEN